MKRIVLFVILLWVSQWTLCGQQMSDSYYAENPQYDTEVDLDTEVDTLLFYTPFINQPRFNRLARYSLIYAGYKPRSGSPVEDVRIGNVPIASPLGRYGDYVIQTLLRRVPSVRTYTYSISQPHESLYGRGERFDVGISSLSHQSRARGYLSGRGYRLGADYHTVGKCENTWDEWHYSLAVGGRVGRDANVVGTYSNNAYLWAAVEKVLPEDGWGYVGHLMAAVMLPYSERAPRSWNSAEAFDLAGDNLYNSYWGYQSGRIRPSRVKSECVPLLYLSWRLGDRYDLGDDVSVELLARAGRRTNAMLDWTEAPNPQPDHYTKLPSYYDDPLVADQVAQAWRRGEDRYRQVDWTMLYDINRLWVHEGARYALMGEREDVRSVVLNFSTGKGRNLWSTDRLPDPEEPSRGRLNLYVAYDSSRNHNEPTDQLGAESLAEGFRLYDYRVSRLAAGGEIGATFGDSESGTIGLGAKVELQRLLYENLAEDNRLSSEGTVNIDTKATWQRSYGWNNTVGAVAHYSYGSPFWQSLFVSPEGATTKNGYARGHHTLGAEAWSRWSVGRVGMSVSLYADYRAGQSGVSNFWNDIDKLYCSFVTGGVDVLSLGAEMSVGVPLGGGFEAEAIVVLGTSRYTSPAVADIVCHDTGRVVATELGCHVEGLRTSSSPEVAVVGRVEGELWNGWTLSVEGALCAGRYVAPSLYFCSDYLLGRNLSPEELSALSEQEDLGVAPNLSLQLMRQIGEQWSLSVALRNLIGANTLYGGYRPMRLVVQSDKANEYITPHATRYQYCYPPHLMITIGYDF